MLNEISKLICSHVAMDNYPSNTDGCNMTALVEIRPGTIVNIMKIKLTVLHLEKWNQKGAAPHLLVSLSVFLD